MKRGEREINRQTVQTQIKRTHDPTITSPRAIALALARAHASLAPSFFVYFLTLHFNSIMPQVGSTSFYSHRPIQPAMSPMPQCSLVQIAQTVEYPHLEKGRSSSALPLGLPTTEPLSMPSEKKSANQAASHLLSPTPTPTITPRRSCPNPDRARSFDDRHRRPRGERTRLALAFADPISERCRSCHPLHLSGPARFQFAIN